MEFLFATPVWGHAHLSVFLEIGLPSLLSPGNLPGLSDPRASVFLIHTRPEDAATLSQSACFRRLSEVMTVEIRHIRDPIIQAHRTMSDCHAEAMREADTRGIPAVFIPPDCVWADGSIAALERIARTGKSVVHMSGVRLNRDAVAAQLDDYLSGDRCVLKIGARALAKLGLDNLHKIAFGHFWNSHGEGLMPANLYWDVPGEGLLARCFHLHPLMIRSQIPFAPFRSTIDDDLALSSCPDASRDYVVTDSDEILAFELSGPERVVAADYLKGSAHSAATWVELGANERHRKLVQHTIRIHPGPMTEARWRPVENEADQAVRSILAINKLSPGPLVLRYPAVAAARLHRFSTEGVAGSWLRSLLLLRGGLASPAMFARRAYALVFLAHGEPRPWHPSWLIRRSLKKTCRQSVRVQGHRIVLVNGDTALSAWMHDSHPTAAISVCDTVTMTSPSWILSQGPARATVVFIRDKDEIDDEAANVLTEVARRGSHVMVFSVDPGSISEKVRSQNAIDIWAIGGLGTRFSYRLLRGIRRTARTVNTSPLGLLAKALAVIVSPIALPVMLFGFLITNTLGLALDRLRTSPSRRVGIA
jgi:hypothetical protein